MEEAKGGADVCCVEIVGREGLGGGEAEVSVIGRAGGGAIEKGIGWDKGRERERREAGGAVGGDEGVVEGGGEGE